jgi:hypothetical protein
MKPAVEGRLAFQAPRQIVGQGEELECGPEHELTRMQHKRLSGSGFHQAGQLVLLLRGVDMGVTGVVEDPEHGVEPDIDAGWLHQGVVERVDAQPPAGDFGPEVTIREQHPESVSACGRDAGSVWLSGDRFPDPWGIRLRSW